MTGELTGNILFSVTNLKQPKREIADYVEANGFPVPERYTSLDDAKVSGKDFVVRSEHPQDLNGGSGIEDNLFVSWQAVADCAKAYLDEPLDWERYFKSPTGNEYKMTGIILAHIQGMSQFELESNLRNVSRPQRVDYCDFAGIKYYGYLYQLSYSYWELLDGLNRAVVADSAINDRYLIFTTIHTALDGFPVPKQNNFLVVERGKIIGGKPLDLPQDSEGRVNSLIERYNDIRNLKRFPKGKCPVMEFQSTGKDDYFLQYYEGREFMEATFKLDRPPKHDEIEAMFVRGAVSSPEGLITEIAVHYGDLPQIPEAAVLDYIWNSMYLETVLPKRVLQIIYSDSGFFTIDPGHMPRSRLLKPQISAVFEHRKLDNLDNTEWSPENPIPKINVNFVSDGRKAYMSRI